MIKYRLIAEVDGEEVYAEAFDTSGELQDHLAEAEISVEDHLMFDKEVE